MSALLLKEGYAGLMAPQVKCLGCKRYGVGVHQEAERYLFGCLQCAHQWAAPLDDPHGLVPKSRWTLAFGLRR